ncbi:MAG: membrane integrity-associated transporter subunit PqiC [Halodesulfovibrio sp.]
MINRHLLLTLVLAVCVLSGCAGGRASPPTALYTLGLGPDAAQGSVQSSGMADSGAKSMANSADGSIELLQVVLPEYLRQTNLLVRNNEYSMSIVGSRQWAGSLEDQLKSAIAIRFGREVGTNRVFTSPVPAGVRMSHYLSVRIFAFEGATDGTVSLRAWWGIYDASRNLVSNGFFDAQDMADKGGDTYQGIVSAQSRLVQRLCEEMGRNFVAVRK